LAAPLLAGDPALDRRAGRPRRHAPARPHQRRAHLLGEEGARVGPVAHLVAGARGADHQVALGGEAAGQAGHEPGAIGRAQRGAVARVPAQLHLAGHLVDVLPARTAGARERLAQLRRRDGEGRADPQVGRLSAAGHILRYHGEPGMGLSSLYLDAFFAAARTLNFSQAAKELHITQSALSQRIKGLEEELDLTLFVRLPRGVQLTEAGARLLRYCQARFSMEQELLEQLTGRSSQEGLGGVIRIGGYSSVVRSVLMPALAPLLRENRHIQVHFQNAEIRELPELLLTGNVDFIVTDTELHRADIETVRLGQEECVMAASARFPVAEGIYLDHDPDDPTTAKFFSLQSGTQPQYR